MSGFKAHEFNNQFDILFKLTISYLLIFINLKMCCKKCNKSMKKIIYFSIDSKIS